MLSSPLVSARSFLWLRETYCGCEKLPVVSQPVLRAMRVHVSPQRCHFDDCVLLASSIMLLFLSSKLGTFRRLCNRMALFVWQFLHL